MEQELENEPRVQVNARIVDPQVWRDFRAIAVSRGIRVGELLEAVMESYVQHEKQQLRAG